MPCSPGPAMKRLFPFVLLAMFTSCVGGTFWFLYSKSQKRPVVFKTEQAAVVDVVKKTVATGEIVPRQEVEIKPRVSGVLETLSVEAGKMVKRGDELAKIQVVPDAASLQAAS